jgi:hypothetical protein
LVSDAYLFGESEIGQFDESVLIDQDVFGFQVSVDDIVLVQVVQGIEDLQEHGFDDGLREAFLLAEVVVQLTSRAEIEHEE